MDDRWETEMIEYGAVNITGFRIVDSTRRHVKEFLKGWGRLNTTNSQNSRRESISVSIQTENLSSQLQLIYIMTIVNNTSWYKQLQHNDTITKITLFGSSFLLFNLFSVTFQIVGPKKKQEEKNWNQLSVRS